MGSALQEFFVALGLDSKVAEWATAQALVDGLETALLKLVEMAQRAAGALGDAVVSTAVYGSHLDDASKKTGLTTQQLEEFAFASQLAGASAETFQTGVIHMAKSMAAARDGSKEAVKAYGALGVRVTDGNGKLRDQELVLNDVADALSKLPEGAERTNAALKVFGKSGADMIPILGEGSVHLKEMREQFRAIVGTLSGDQVQMLDKFDDTLVTLRAFGSSVVREFAMPIVQALQPIVDKTLAWIKANRALITERVTQWGQRFAAVVTAVADGVGWLIDHFDEVVMWLKLIAVALASVATAMTILMLPAIIESIAAFAALALAATVAAAEAALAWFIAALPLLAIAVLIAILILAFDEFFTFLQGGETVLGHILERYWDKIDAFLQRVRGAIHSMLGPLGSALFELGIQEFNKRSLEIGDFVGGGAESPAASAALQSSSTSSTTSKSLTQVHAPFQITVQQQPGESGSDLARRIVDQVKTYLDSELQKAQSHTP